MESISCSAHRDRGLTGEEAARLDDIVCGYAVDSALGSGGGGFIASTAEGETGTIFGGSVRLTGRGVDERTDAFLFWSDCMSDLRRALPDAEWRASLDGTPLVWDEECGWCAE